MAGKLQRNALGKLVRNAAGKIIRSLRCCCGQPPIPGCNLVAEPMCETGVSSITVKVVIAGVSNEAGPTSVFELENLGGSVNRTYYINLFGQPVFGPPGPQPASTRAWGGYFLAAAKTNAAGAIDYQDPARRGEWYNLSLSLYTGDGQEYASGVVSSMLVGWPISDEGLWFCPDEDTVFFADGSYIRYYNTTADFCTTETSISNELPGAGIDDPLGTGGTMTITPCPPCAVECDGPSCVTMEASVECDAASPDNTCIGPSAQFAFFGRFAGRSGVRGVGPAGCMWVYINYTNATPANDRRVFYIWYDGQDWQAILAIGHVDDCAEIARTAFAGDISCVGGILEGTITLEYFNPVATGTGLVDLCLADDCLLTVTLGTCECFELTGNVDNNDTVEFNAGADFPAGDYEVEYLSGAISYGPGQGFRINFATGSGGGGYKILSGGSYAADAPGDTTEYADQAAVEAANVGPTTTFTHTAGPIGIYLVDGIPGDNTTDATNGSPSAPRFRICRVPS